MIALSNAINYTDYRSSFACRYCRGAAAARERVHEEVKQAKTTKHVLHATTPDMQFAFRDRVRDSFRCPGSVIFTQKRFLLRPRDFYVRFSSSIGSYKMLTFMIQTIRKKRLLRPRIVILHSMSRKFIGMPLPLDT